MLFFLSQSVPLGGRFSIAKQIVLSFSQAFLDRLLQLGVGTGGQPPVDLLQEALPQRQGQGFLEEIDRRMAARAYAQLEQSIQESLGE